MCCGRGDDMDEVDKVDGAATGSVEGAEGSVEGVEPVATPRARLGARRKDIVQVRYVGPGFLLGVPARDLSVDEWVALTDSQRDAALHSKVFEIMKEGE